MERAFRWPHPSRFGITVLFEAGPREAIVLASPSIRWHLSTDYNREYLFERLAAAMSAVLCTDEVAQSVFDKLLQIRYWRDLLPYITADLWS